MKEFNKTFLYNLFEINKKEDSVSYFETTWDGMDINIAIFSLKEDFYINIWDTKNKNLLQKNHFTLSDNNYQLKKKEILTSIIEVDLNKFIHRCEDDYFLDNTIRNYTIDFDKDESLLKLNKII